MSEEVCYWPTADEATGECRGGVRRCEGCKQFYCEEHGRLKDGYCLGCRIEFRNAVQANRRYVASQEVNND